jgi:hypothetical protein
MIWIGWLSLIPNPQGALRDFLMLSFKLRLPFGLFPFDTLLKNLTIFGG